MARMAEATSMPARLRAALEAVTPGRVAALSDLAAHLQCASAQVARLQQALAGQEPDAPWHRAVADGGAVGRHARRADQIARLVREGVVVSPAGIVQDFAARRCRDFDAEDPRAAPGGRTATATGVGGESGSTNSRARGRLAQPSSTVGRK